MDEIHAKFSITYIIYCRFTIDRSPGVNNSIPIIQHNKTVAYSYVFDSDTFVEWAFVKKVSGTASVKIGTTIGGDELYFDMEINTIQPFKLEHIFLTGESIYFTITGTVDIRMDTKPQLL
jgi:hypothetical protein